MSEDILGKIAEIQDHIQALEKLNLFIMNTIDRLKEMRDKDPMLNKYEKTNIDEGLIEYLFRVIDSNECRIKELRMAIWKLRLEAKSD